MTSDHRIEAAGVRVGHEDAVATVTIARADEHDAVTPELDAAMSAVLRTLGAVEAVRVVVLTGIGASIGRRAQGQAPAEPRP